MENRQTGIYGDHIKQKRHGMFRILFQNPQGLGRIESGRSTQSLKITKLKDLLLKHNFDVVGLSEVNKDWRVVPPKETLWTGTEGWFEYRRLTTSINYMVPPHSQIQYGGIALMAINKVAYSIVAVEDDHRKLGRWTSFLFKGKQSHKCRIICAYCPCRSDGPSSTYALQVVGLAKENIMECPRKQFWRDLKAFIQTCQEQEEQVVIMGDWNSNYTEVVQWMEHLDLHDILKSRHEHGNPPPTCKRSSSYPLDAIFAPSQFKCWRGGYLAFDRLEGDHRGIWCDIPIEYLLGFKMQHSAHFQARRLKTKDPRIRKRYLRHLHHSLQQAQVYKRFENLNIVPGIGLLPTDILHFEGIDNDITNAMLQAEKKCRKFKTGEVRWSPLYQKACDRVTYWNMLQKEAKGERINTRKIRSLRTKLGMARMQLTLKEISNKLEEAIKSRKRCKNYAPELQMDYRYRLAKALEEEDKIPAATHIRNLTHQENTRALFRRIRYMENKIRNLSTSRITITTKGGRTVEKVKKEEVEQGILRANEVKYHQTEGTGQLQKQKLLHDLGTMGEGKCVPAVLAGTYRVPSGTSRVTKQFLQIMEKPDTVCQVPSITFEEFRTGWIKAKERTSSNGPHFGHYKASMHHPQIAQLLYKRSLLPMVTGYSPRRHRMGVDVMLLKKENSYAVDNLRTIVLFDSEANMNYKHLGRRAMQAALKHRLIATEQYSRPNRKSIDHALNRRLVMDHQLYIRQPYAITSCDLKSCYDRINHTSASLALQRTGIAKPEILSMFKSIQHMTHRIRTAFGDSTISYGGCDNNGQWKLPPQGVLQGNGSGPAIWSILSSSIFQLLRQNGHCNAITSSLRRVSLELSGFAYVDDTDLLQVNDNVDDLVRQMQRTLLAWNDAVGVTGGILSPPKCWWYLITFMYKAGEWKAVTPPRDFNLWLRNENKTRVEIARIDPSKGTNMLGVYLAPDGNTKDHVRALRTKTETWAKNIIFSRATSDEVWTAIHRTIPFSICYSLPAVTLTKDECRSVMAPITKFGLPRAGIASTIPHVIKVGSVPMGGLGIIDPYIQMGVGKVVNFLSNTWQHNPTGILQDITLDDFVLELGLNMPWSTDLLKKGMKYVTGNTWIYDMVAFCTEQEIEIDFQQYAMPSQQRARDRTIMELALIYTDKVNILKSINRVRMALRVIWISDITVADGGSIDTKWLEPRPYNTVRNNFNWPKEHRVTVQDWRIWRRWAQSIDAERLGQVSRSRWECTRDQWVDHWDGFTTMDQEMLYIRSTSGQGWRRHIRQPGRRRHINRYFSESLACTEFPEDPTNVNRASFKPYQNYIEVISESRPPLQWFINKMTAATYWGPYVVTKNVVLQKIQEIINPMFLEASQDLDLLFRDFSKGTVVAVSDGSFLRETAQSAAAWIIESECRTQWIMGSIFVPGRREDYSSYRSEVTGLVAIAVTLKILAGGCSQPRHIIIGCDGQSALLALNTKREDVNANCKHADLLSILVDVWTSSTMKPFTVHVRGHQDNRDQRALTRLEKMNVIMDKLATMTAAAQTSTIPSFRIPFMGIRSVRYDNHILGGEVNKQLYKIIVDSQLQQYLERKLLMNGITMASVDLKAFGHARLRSQIGMIKFISKWMSNTLATGVVLQRRKHRIFNRCPRCNEWGEDKVHVLICWDIRAEIIRTAYLKNLRKLLVKTSTDARISEFIIDGLNKFFRHPRTSGRAAQPTIAWQQEQQDIGWVNFMTGFIGKAVTQKQMNYYRAIGSRQRGTQWASQIIMLNWQLLFQLWTGRNEVLHQKEIINSISGAALLDIEIEKLYDEGYADLPQTAKKWFKLQKSQLLEKSTEYKKGWVLIVRTIRESLHIAEYSIFSSSKALRNWVGLQRPSQQN